MRLSVVVPTYNRAHVIGAAVESLLRQDMREVEVIVVDDGSTDDTISVLAAIDDSRLRVMEADHLGANAARHAGVAASRAPLISFLDSDDVVEPEWARTMVGLLEFADVASCGHLNERDGVEVSVSSPQAMAPFFPEIVASFRHGGTYAMRKTLYEEAGGLAIPLRSGQHTEFGYRVAKLSQSRRVNFASTSEALVRYRIGSAGNIRGNYEARADGVEYFLEHHADLFAANRRERAAAYYRLGVYRLWSGRRRQGQRALVASLKARPGLRSWARLAQSIVHGGRAVDSRFGQRP